MPHVTDVLVFERLIHDDPVRSPALLRQDFRIPPVRHVQFDDLLRLARVPFESHQDAVEILRRGRGSPRVHGIAGAIHAADLETG